MTEVYSPFGTWHVFFLFSINTIKMKIPTTSAIWSTGNMLKYCQSDVYIYQCDFLAEWKLKRIIFSIIWQEISIFRFEGRCVINAYCIKCFVNLCIFSVIQKLYCHILCLVIPSWNRKNHSCHTHFSTVIHVYQVCMRKSLSNLIMLFLIENILYCLYEKKTHKKQTRPWLHVLHYKMFFFFLNNVMPPNKGVLLK